MKARCYDGRFKLSNLYSKFSNGHLEEAEKFS
jgi:hypothetical protein